MAKKKKSSKRPPCPDPELYVWVNRIAGGYWKLKRGTIKQAVLNDSFKQNSSAFAITSPAAGRIRNKLEEFTGRLAVNSLHQRLNGKLVKAYNTKGIIDFSQFSGFEIQADHPLEAILPAPYQVQQKKRLVEILIPVSPGVVKQHNRLVTDFYFEAILLYGDVLKAKGLQTEYAVSKPYSFINTITDECKLVLPLPANNEPWILLLKVSCLEGNEMAIHAKHYGMKVVAWG